MKLKLHKSLMIAAAMTMVLGISVGSALAYFSANEKASGSANVKLGTNTKIHEEIDEELNKIISVTNEGETECYIRVIVNVSVDGVTAQMDEELSAGWNKELDGNYYYADYVMPGESTSELKININIDETVRQDFDVVVSQESTNYIFEGSNTPSYDGWQLTADDNYHYSR